MNIWGVGEIKFQLPDYSKLHEEPPVGYVNVWQDGQTIRVKTSGIIKDRTPVKACAEGMVEASMNYEDAIGEAMEDSKDGWVLMRPLL